VISAISSATSSVIFSYFMARSSPTIAYAATLGSSPKEAMAP
jgi:hypothetical protein